MNYKFSIITPAHKKTPYLKELYDSIVAQTYDNWEWVLWLNNALYEEDLEEEEDKTPTPVAPEAAEEADDATQIASPEEAAPAEPEEEEDPLAEVNVFLAFDQFDQAIDFVKSAIEREPDNLDFHTRLLEVYYSASDKKGFEEHARVLHDKVNGEGSHWDMAVTMWSEMSPNRALFEAGAEAEEEAAPAEAAGTGGIMDLTAGEEESAADGEKSWAASAGILHSPTGIFVQGSYRNIEVEVVGSDIPEADVYYLQGGIKQKWNSLGATAIWGEYAQGDDGWFTANAEEAGVTYNSTELSRWGVGLTQWVDAAKMQLYLIYQHTELDAVDGAGLAVDTEDFDSVIAGGSIRF